tara:strand:+ start:2056 stop:2490 length:435 start_codon:yes stop_codon:yes gene_type:complete
MALIATYDSNFVQSKEGAGKGKTFHRYNVSGTKAELKEFTSSEQFKAYPRNCAKTGAPQIVTMYMDALRDELPVYQKQDGNFTLDGSETRKDLTRAEMLEQQSPALASKFADRVMAKISGVQQSAIDAVKQAKVETEQKEIDAL